MMQRMIPFDWFFRLIFHVFISAVTKDEEEDEILKKQEPNKRLDGVDYY